MSDELEQSKIGFAAIIFWDFADESDEEELLASLCDIYGEAPQERGGVTLGGGGGWRRHIAGNGTNEIEAAEGFESVRTIVDSNTRGILDITTFAVLSEQQIQMVVEEEYRSGLEGLQSTISEYLQMLPTYVDHESANHCGLYYAEWAEGDLLPEVEDVSEEEIVKHLENEHETLSSFGFQVGGNLSLYNGKFFIAPTAIMGPFDGLAAIRRKQHPDSGPLEEVILDPPWYKSVSGLARYYRLKQWADSRWNRLNEFDSDADDARESLFSLSSSQVDVDEVLPVSEEVQGLQIEYTEFRTRFDVEYLSFQDSFENRADEGTDMFGNPIDIPLPRPDEPEELERSEDRTNSIIGYFEEASDHTLEQMDDRYTQATEKINTLISPVESRTRLAATDENLTLQGKVQKLTVILTALTGVLVILTIVLVGLELV